MFLPKLVCLLLASSLLVTATGCQEQTQQPAVSSSQDTSAQSETSSAASAAIPAPTYATGGNLPDGYTLDLSGIDPRFVSSDGKNWSDIDFLTSVVECFHDQSYAAKHIPASTPIAAPLGLDPTGATTHPMMLFSAYDKNIVEQTGKLQIDETVYSRAELSSYLVYADDAYEIYEIQPLICGQSFPDCWAQLMQYAVDIRKDPSCPWANSPINMEYNQYLLDAYTYFSEHVTELIVPS